MNLAINYRDLMVLLMFLLNVPRSYRCGRYQEEQCSRIIGGVPGHIEDFPFMAYILRKSLQDGKVSSCGASYIDRHWLITAGHCIYEGAPRHPEHVTYVFMGMTNKSARVNIWVQKRIAAEVFHHPQYKKRAMSHTGFDIGLIMIRLPFRLNRYVQIGQIPFTALDYRGVQVAAIGWGRINANSSQKPDTLQVLKTKVWRDKPKKCSRVSLNPICIGTKKRRGSYGDSGGPLVYQDLIIGVLSRGCRNIYENIYSHVKWIDQIMARGNFTVRRMTIRFNHATRHAATTVAVYILCLGFYCLKVWFL